MEFALGLLDREIVDAGEAPLHQTVLSKLPVFVAVRTKPVSRLVVPFVGEAHVDTVSGKGPQLLDETIVELISPFARQKSDDLVPAPHNFGPIAPGAVRCISECAPLRTARIPAIFGASDLLNGSIEGERWKWRAALRHVGLHS